MKLKEGLVLKDILGETVLVGEGANHVNFNKMISFNSTAEFLWRSVEGVDFNSSTLADNLVKEYNIDRELAEKDAEALLKKWVENDLVE